MNNQETIPALEARISLAVADLKTWRATGLSEKYMEAYCLVEALQQQLQHRLRAKTWLLPPTKHS